MEEHKPDLDELPNSSDIGEIFAGDSSNHDEVDQTGPVEQPQLSIAGFWRRLLAFVIDVVLMAVPLIMIGFAFRNIAFSLGPYGRLVGFVLSIVYWGHFNSFRGSGQTIGKRLTRIAVIGSHHHYLGSGPAYLRAGFLALIFLLNGWALPLLQNPLFAFLTTIIVFGGLFSFVYAFVFNRTTRQGLHDLLVGSYVVNAPPQLQAIPPQIPPLHQRLTVGLLGIGLLIALSGLLLQQRAPAIGNIEPGEWEELLELQATLMAEGEFFAVTVNRVNRRQVGGPAIAEDLNIEVWTRTSCSANINACNELIREIAGTAFATYENIESLSGMRVIVANRFDLGLATGNISRGAAFTIEDWQAELGLETAE